MVEGMLCPLGSRRQPLQERLEANIKADRDEQASGPSGASTTSMHEVVSYPFG
jgi:hypothetical protein